MIPTVVVRFSIRREDHTAMRKTLITEYHMALAGDEGLTAEFFARPMYVDTNPFLFAGRVEGAMVRLSDSPVVNVTSGGGETGFFVIEGEARQ